MTKLLFIFQKKLSMINLLNVSVILKIRTFCVVISQNCCFDNVLFETKFLKFLKNEIFKLFLSFIERIEKNEVIFNVFRVIAITLTNDEKNIE